MIGLRATTEAAAGVVAIAAGILADAAVVAPVSEVVAPLAQLGGLGLFAWAVWQGVRDLRAELRALGERIDKLTEKIMRDE